MENTELEFRYQLWGSHDNKVPVKRMDTKQILKCISMLQQKNYTKLNEFSKNKWINTFKKELEYRNRFTALMIKEIDLITKNKLNLQKKINFAVKSKNANK
jgi:hypothetical protein